MTTGILFGVFANNVPAAIPPQLAAYSGRLVPVRVADRQAVSKGFEITWFHPRVENPEAEEQLAETLYMVEEDAHALPWFLRAGVLSPVGPRGPVVGYQIEDRPQLVELPPLLLQPLLAKSSNEIPEDRVETTIDGRDCLAFEGVLPSGRRAHIIVDRESGQLVSYKGIVVIGRGDRLELTLELNKSEALSDEKTHSLTALANRLEQVVPKMGEVANPVTARLPQATWEAIAKDRNAWLAAARETPYQTYVDEILQDVEQRQDGKMNIEQVRKRMIGKPAPALPKTLLNGAPLSETEFQDKSIILHFWAYQSNPPVDQFAQVGDLDFLARKYADKGVVVIGVATDSRFRRPDTSDAASRATRQFVEFMNLSYPISRDDGSLLKTFGDPISVDSELPLWVLIDSSGVVRAYKAGLYEQKPGAGLIELEQAIQEIAAEDAPNP